MFFFISFLQFPCWHSEGDPAKPTVDSPNLLEELILSSTSVVGFVFKDITLTPYVKFDDNLVKKCKEPGVFPCTLGNVLLVNMTFCKSKISVKLYRGLLWKTYSSKEVCTHVERLSLNQTSKNCTKDPRLSTYDDGNHWSTPTVAVLLVLLVLVVFAAVVVIIVLVAMLLRTRSKADSMCRRFTEQIRELEKKLTSKDGLRLPIPVSEVGSQDCITYDGKFGGPPISPTIQPSGDNVGSSTSHPVQEDFPDAHTLVKSEQQEDKSIGSLAVDRLEQFRGKSSTNREQYNTIIEEDAGVETKILTNRMFAETCQSTEGEHQEDQGVVDDTVRDEEHLQDSQQPHLI